MGKKNFVTRNAQYSETYEKKNNFQFLFFEKWSIMYSNFLENLDLIDFCEPVSETLIKSAQGRGDGGVRGRGEVELSFCFDFDEIFFIKKNTACFFLCVHI